MLASLRHPVLPAVLDHFVDVDGQLKDVADRRVVRLIERGLPR